MKEQFIEHKFRKDSLDRITTVNEIIGEYSPLGYRLSLRQLFYQLVSRDMIENSQAEYKKLGALVSDARLAGLVDWDAIEDRGRETVIVSTWATPADIIATAADSFRVDRWANQPVHIEVVVEKDALSGVLSPVCNRLGVPFSANRGYTSSSFFYAMGKRLADKYQDDKRVIVLYLGDHDPSGMDMTDDVTKRLTLFSRAAIEIQRIALNMPQVEQYGPPPNTAKETDTRYAAYVRQFGRTCWELDAIEPTEMARIVTERIERHIDPVLWAEAESQESRMKDTLQVLARSM